MAQTGWQDLLNVGSDEEIQQRIHALERLLEVRRLVGSASRGGQGGATTTAVVTTSAAPVAPPPAPPSPTRLEDVHLLVVTNRLPVSISKKPPSQDEKGGWTFSVSSGGLVSALKGVKGLKMTWIGWPGCDIEDEEARQEITAKLREKGCVPVWLPKKIIDLYYSGFSNTILWPLFHYQQPPIEILESADDQFAAYTEANRRFAEVVLSEYKPDNIIWVHDYHLFLLPNMLRQQLPSTKIGFFLHTAFPSSELYRTLPWREELLQGVLAANLIGFHTHDYARHFQSACTRILGLQCTTEGVNLGDGFTAIDTFPIGIDAEHFLNTMQGKAVQEHIKALRAQFGEKKVILGIDRLDYIKGIPHKLYAMERFLKNNPEWRDKVVLVQIAVPSRSDVVEYQRLAKRTHELVGRINGKYGTLTGVPIHFLDTSISFERMCALYRVSHVCLVSSVRDGMNLVAFEYIICQDEEDPGVLILSEFTGAAQSLGAGAISINPWDVNNAADAIKYALSMSVEERRENHHYASRYVRKHTAQHWAESFITELVANKHAYSVPAVPPPLPLQNLINSFRKARNRVIITGLIGTLTHKRIKGTNNTHYRAFPKASPNIQRLINALANDPNTTFVILSLRSTKMCERILGDTDAMVGAENGYFLRSGPDKGWRVMFDNVDLSWMKEVYQVFLHFTERTPRSFIEQRSTFISWHYHDCDESFGERQARELLIHLLGGPLANTATQVVNYNKILQVRPVGVSKGFFADRILQEIEAKKGPVDFVLCMGNFPQIDEDVFTFLTGSTAATSPDGSTAAAATAASPSANSAIAATSDAPSMAVVPGSAEKGATAAAAAAAEATTVTGRQFPTNLRISTSLPEGILACAGSMPSSPCSAPPVPDSSSSAAAAVSSSGSSLLSLFIPPSPAEVGAETRTTTPAITPAAHFAPAGGAAADAVPPTPPQLLLTPCSNGSNTPSEAPPGFGFGEVLSSASPTAAAMRRRAERVMETAFKSAPGDSFDEAGAQGGGSGNSPLLMSRKLGTRQTLAEEMYDEDETAETSPLVATSLPPGEIPPSRLSPIPLTRSRTAHIDGEGEDLPLLSPGPSAAQQPAPFPVAIPPLTPSTPAAAAAHEQQQQHWQQQLLGPTGGGPIIGVNGREVWTVVVGKKQSRAQYSVSGVHDVEKILTGLVSTLPSRFPRLRPEALQLASVGPSGNTRTL